MIPDRIYSRDADEVQRQKDSTPRATALLGRVFEALYRAKDPETCRNLESLQGALSLHCSFKEDLSETGAREYEKRLDLIVPPDLLDKFEAHLKREIKR